MRQNSCLRSCYNVVIRHIGTNMQENDLIFTDALHMFQMIARKLIVTRNVFVLNPSVYSRSELNFCTVIDRLESELQCAAMRVVHAGKPAGDDARYSSEIVLNNDLTLHQAVPQIQVLSVAE